VLVDKPGGWTSHDVVGRCRRIFGIRRIGHAGTLDPMATGLLVIALGRATRLLRFVQESAKTYEATAVFGVATDSLDADGAILTCEEMRFGEAELRDVARRFLGVIPQVPPMVSAIKVEGRRLYQLARAGLEVDRPSRPVEIHSLDILEVSPGIYPEVSFRVTCGSGTYIRVLADDMARALGGRAHLSALRRTAIGPHRVEGAHTVAALEEAAHRAVESGAPDVRQLDEGRGARVREIGRQLPESIAVAPLRAAFELDVPGAREVSRRRGDGSGPFEMRRLHAVRAVVRQARQAELDERRGRIAGQHRRAVERHETGEGAVVGRKIAQREDVDREMGEQPSDFPQLVGIGGGDEQTHAAISCPGACRRSRAGAR